jgi:hypothetical protein
MSTPAPGSGFAPPFDSPDAAPRTPSSTATDRLLLSRANLRAAIVQRAEAEARAQVVDAVDADATALARFWSRWKAWRPLGLAGVLAARTADAFVGPIVQRHPVRMTLGAIVVGGLLVWSRPWRWTLGSALLAGLLPRLFTHGRPPARASAWLPLVSALAAALLRPREASSPPNAFDASPARPPTNPRVPTH